MIRRAAIAARRWAVLLGAWLGRRLPEDPQVLFATAHSRVLRGNLAIVAEGLDRRTPPVAYRTLTSFPAAGWRGRFAVLAHSAVAGFRLARARVVVLDDYFFPLYVLTPRPGSTVIQLWHGCGAFKKFGYSLIGKTFGADEDMVSQVRIHLGYDVCLVSSMGVATHYAEAFDQPLERFRADLGIPRTDVLFGEMRIARTVAAVRARYAIPAGKRVVLYAPTFRGDTNAARFADDLDLRAMAAALADDHVVLVRLHPFVRAAAPLDPALAGFAIDVSDHPDINELLLVADLLITDYSSVIYEFSLLERPMVFFAPDHAAYERERGFYFDYRTGVPGPIAETTAEVIARLRDDTFDLERVRAFRDANFDVADGRATERVIETLIVPALRP